jgi:hypothetical protein
MLGTGIAGPAERLGGLARREEKVLEDELRLAFATAALEMGRRDAEFLRGQLSDTIDLLDRTEAELAEARAERGLCSACERPSNGLRARMRGWLR